MKKLLLTAVTTVIAICAILAVSLTTSAETYGDWTYSVTNGEATVTGYNGTQTAVTIPSKIDGKAVTAIGEEAFYRNLTLESVTIPDSVKSIA